MGTLNDFIPTDAFTLVERAEKPKTQVSKFGLTSLRQKTIFASVLVQGMTQFTPKLYSLLRGGSYSVSDLRADLFAGLTVAVIALPLAMALGIASGVSPEKGLLTAIIAGFLISLLGGSRVQIGGPTGAFVVVLYQIIAEQGYSALLVATFLAGILLIIAGYAKLGQTIKFIPQPVVIGFTSAIAIVIASTQIKEFFGLTIDAIPSDFVEKWLSYFHARNSVNISALMVGLEAILTIAFLRKIAPKSPSYLLALIITSLTVAILQLPVDTIGSRFSEMALQLPTPQLPDFSFHLIQKTLPSALTIAFLAGIEALLSAIVADGMTGYKHRSNQELVAQGFANVSSALCGGIPATGAIARTAMNITAGAKTPLAGIFHALFLLLFVLFANDAMKFIPMPTLAAILFFVAKGMSEMHRFFYLLSFPGGDRLLLLLTFFLTILVDLTVAIGVGVAFASLLFMVRMSRAVEISSAGGLGEEEGEEDQRGNLPSAVEVFWIAGPIFFAIAGEIPDLLRRIGREPKILIIRMRLVPFLDATGLAALHDLIKQCRLQNIEVIFSALQQQPAATLLPQEKESHVSYVSSFEEAKNLAKVKLSLRS